jgi:hypothetical protein
MPCATGSFPMILATSSIPVGITRSRMNRPPISDSFLVPPEPLGLLARPERPVPILNPGEEMPMLVCSEYVRSEILPSLLGMSSRYSNHVNPHLLHQKVVQAVREVEQRLSTRMQITHMKGWLGPGPRPPNVPGADATDSTPAIEPLEYEGPYPWEAISPSDGFLQWRVNLRPLQQVIGGYFMIPGSFAPGVKIEASWMRPDPLSGTLTLMPQYGSAALILPNLPFGLFNWMQQRINHSMLWEYRAGMSESDWDRYPQINQLIGLRAAIKYLPILSTMVNPSGVTSESGDGLSISRSSGYVFKDIEERLVAEADGIQNEILDAWDGPAALGVL